MLGRSRNALARVLSTLPAFTGKGRMTMFLDSLLTDYSDPDSYHAIVELFGARILLDLRAFGERFVFYYRQYESDSVAMFRKVYAGGNFIDVGSNIGIYVVCMSDLVRKAGARIFSVEPLAANSTRQLANIELNGCADLVDLLPFAAGAHVGTLRMDGDFSSTNINGVVSPNGALSVEVTTLDRLAAEHNWSRVGAIKIDVEGYEPEVFRGGAALIERDRPIIFAEFNRERMAMNGFTMAESWQMLRGLHYRAYYLATSHFCELAEPGDHENLFFLPA